MKKKRLQRGSLTVGALLIMMSSLSAFAQDSLDVKVNNLEKKVTTLDKIVEKLPKMSGFINTQYTYSDDGTSTVQIRRARLDFKGDLSKYVDYRLQVDFASSPKIVDAFIRFKITPYFNVQIGQFKVPFTLENPYAPLKLEAIDNAQVITYLSGFNNGFNKDNSGMGRDLGLTIYGGFIKKDGFNVIDYTLGVFNGNGVNTKDNNKKKDFAGRLEIHPIKALTLAASFYNGRMNGYTNTTEIMPKNKYAFSIRYDDTKYLFRAEYLRGKSDLGAVSSSGAPTTTTTDGYYAIIGYWIKGKVCPLLRYDTYRKDVLAENGRSTFYMAGIDYWPWKFVRMQLNYTLKDIQSKDKLVNQVTAMVSVKF